MRKLKSAVILAVVSVGTACAALGNKVFKEPVVNFKNVQLNGIGLTGGTLDVVLSVYNPNGYKLDATKLTYNLLVDTIPFGTGQLDSRFVVQSGDSSEVRLPIAFSYAGLGSAGRQLINTGSVPYRVRGAVTVSTPLGDFTRPFDRSATFTALRGSSSR
ncbi:MAG TPA: LEA type 2 family protein [Gemmatimonadaceae bacterium]|nr:LEA type 2 family protein [Gemmatimonadaceae bacterium]